jgi:hypothetical protein
MEYLFLPFRRKLKIFKRPERRTKNPRASIPPSEKILYTTVVF